MKTWLKYGALAGLVGGIVMASFMLVVGRDAVEDAIALEAAAETSDGTDQDPAEQNGHSHGGDGGVHEEMFTRSVQEIGGALGLLLFGGATGLIFAVVLAASMPHLGAASGFDASLRLGLLGFWTVVVIPFLKFPANPPAVGDPDTINERTILYFLAVGVSIALSVAAVRVARDAPFSAPGRTWIAVAFYAAGLVLVFALIPDNPDEVSAPAELVWRFRVVSVSGLAALWAAMALTMGTLIARSEARSSTAGAYGAVSAP